MVIDGKVLVKAMNLAYKGPGYTVSTEKNNAGIEQMTISTARWAVIMEKEAAPGNVIGKIAEHLRELPKPGEAFKVKKGENQTEIFGMAHPMIRAVHEDDPVAMQISRIGLSMEAHSLWQRKPDGRIFMVDKEEEAMLSSLKNIFIIGEKALFADDMQSRAYIQISSFIQGYGEALGFLQQRMWAV